MKPVPPMLVSIPEATAGPGAGPAPEPAPRPEPELPPNDPEPDPVPDPDPEGPPDETPEPEAPACGVFPCKPDRAAIIELEIDEVK